MACALRLLAAAAAGAALAGARVVHIAMSPAASVAPPLPVTLTSRPTPTPAPLPWLHVRPVDLEAAPNATRRFVFSDEYGREVTLRGACVENEERNFPGNHTQRPQDPAAYADGACPENYGSYEEPPICEVDAGRGRYNASFGPQSRNDYAQLRALGFNVVRLCLSWSELEPTPGVYSQTYVDRVRQLVSWGAEQGVYSIIGECPGAWFCCGVCRRRLAAGCRASRLLNPPTATTPDHAPEHQTSTRTCTPRSSSPCPTRRRGTPPCWCRPGAPATTAPPRGRWTRSGGRRGLCWASATSTWP